jgi:DNA-binding CsgD family transcriptional regulator
MNTRRKLKTSDAIVVGLILVQATLACVSLFDIVTNILGFQKVPLAWTLREVLEISSSVGLLLGIAVGVILLLRVRKQIHVADNKLRVATAAFTDLVEQEFDGWGLSRTEREVALMALKGLSNAEISQVAGKKEGTVKAQCNAIFRKAGVSNRGQLASLFFEVLMQEPLGQEASNKRVEVGGLR